MALCKHNQNNEEKRYTYSFVEEPICVNVSQNTEDDSCEYKSYYDDIPYEYGTKEYQEELNRRFREDMRKYNEEYNHNYVQPYSFTEQIKNIDKLNVLDRIDLACGIALVPCAVGITFAWLFVGVIINCAFWALNFWVFSGDLRFGCEWMLIPFTIILDLVIFFGGWIIFKKWWFLILAISFGLALWVFNM